MNRMREEIRKYQRGPISETDVGRSASFQFPPEFIGFQGHFPGRPVLPGICKIQMALTVCSGAAAPVRLLEVCSAKFLAPVSVGEEVRVDCRQGAGTDADRRVSAKLYRADDLVARIELRVSRTQTEAAP